MWCGGVRFFWRNVKVVMRLDPLSLFWYILMLLMLVSVILRLMHERRRRRLRIEEPKVVTTLRCCITIKRDFKPGNHILGQGESCPKCGKPMLIEAIYRVPRQQERLR